MGHGHKGHLEECHYWGLAEFKTIREVEWPEEPFRVTVYDI